MACSASFRPVDVRQAAGTRRRDGTAIRHMARLAVEAWSDTLATLHMWTQIVGKVRLVQSPWVNHSWHVTLYVTASGLTTSPIPYGTRTFEMEFDFIAHQLAITTGEGRTQQFRSSRSRWRRSTRALMEALDALDLPVKIHAKPNEVAEAIPFDQDETHRSYDREYASTVLARAGAGRSGLQSLSRPLRREVQPGAFLLGRRRISRSRGSRDGRRRSIRAAFRTCRTGSPARRIRTRSAAAGSGPAADRSPIRRSTRTPIRSRRVPEGAGAARVAPSTARTFASSSCRTTRSGWRRLPTTRSSSSCRRPTRRPRRWRRGIAPRASSGPSSARAEPGECG